jgi:hypothetical protein
MPDAWQPGAADLGAFWRTGESPTFRSLDAAAKALADPYIRRSARASAADIDAAVVRVKAYEAKAVQDYYAGQPRAQTPGFSGKIALPVTPEAVEAHQRAWMVHNIAQAKQAVRDQRKLVPLPVRVAHLEGITVEGRELLRRQKDLSELEEQHRVTDYPSISAVIAAANAQIVDAYEVKAKALMDRKRMAAAVIEGGCRSGNAGLVRMARNGQWEQAAVAAEKWRRAQGSGAVRELPALALTDGDTSYDLGAGVGQTI